MTPPPLLGPCRPSIVRYDPGPGGPDHDDDVLVGHVEQAVDEWLPTICSFLHRQPQAPIVVTLRRGTWVSRTKGTHVLLPVAPGAGADAALGAVRAGLAHELVHAVAGRLSNDTLNEGLAVHVDSTLRLAGPSWPFCDLAPHRWVAILREEGTFTPLADLLSGRAMPRADSPVDTMIVQWARYYLQAGSFVGFLLDEMGVDRFLSPDGDGQVLPHGDGMAALEEAWLRRVGGPPTEAEWQRGRRSITSQIAKYRDAGRPDGCVRPPV